MYACVDDWLYILSTLIIIDQEPGFIYSPSTDGEWEVFYRKQEFTKDSYLNEMWTYFLILGIQILAILNIGSWDGVGGVQN